MLFRLLGPLEVHHDGRSLPIGTPRTRAVLGILLARQGNLVSVEQLIDELWPENPPADSRSLIHGYLSRLRKALSASPEASQRLVTRKPGYVLRLRDGDCDVHLFERAAAQARDAACVGRFDDAVSLFRQAHRLWRGEPLADVPRTPTIAATATALNELRLGTLAEQFDAALDGGQAAELVADLTEHVNANPLREQLVAQLMVALYRCGRQADALQAFRDTRSRLVEELGVEPGARLQQLHRRMLATDPALEIAVARPDPDPAVMPPPAQLPPAPHVMYGREREVAEAVAILTAADRMPVCMIHGMAGVGKTALGLGVAHRIRERFPDGQLWIDLRAADASPVSALDALGRFLRALGLPSAALPDDLDERAALYRSAMADRRVLVLLDNAVSEAQVRPLLPGTAGCCVVVTGRTCLSELPNASSLHLDVLQAKAAADLVTDAGDESPEVAAEVADLCGYLPLALRMVAAKTGGHPPRPLTEVRDRLRDERHRLDELSAAEMGVRTSLDVSWSELAEPDRDMLKRLAALDISGFGATTASLAIDGGPPGGASTAQRLVDRLDHLTARHWLEVTGTGADGQRRYGLHDLIRLFVRQTGPLPDGVVAAMLRNWLRHSDAAAAALPILRIGVHTGHNPQIAAPNWFDAEQHSLAGLVRQAVCLGHDETAVALAEHASVFFELRSDLREWNEVVSAVAPVVDRGDPRLRVRSLCLLAGAEIGAYRLDPAQTRCESAERLATEHGDAVGAAHSLSLQGYVAGFQGRFELARRRYEAAIENLVALGDQQCAAISRQALANALARRPGNATRVRALAEAAAGWFRAHGDLIGQAGCCMALVYGLREQGDHRGALAAAQRMRALCRRAGDELGAAVGERLTGELYSAQGHLSEAHQALDAALATNRRLRSPSGVASSLLRLGDVAGRLGRTAEAKALLTESEQLWRQLGRQDMREQASDRLAAL